MAIFAIVFGRLAKLPSDGLPYPLFVLTGLLPWTLFSTAITASGQSLVGSAHLVSKVYFPRLIIPISALGAAFLDFVISALLLLVLMGWYHVGFHWGLLALPLLSAGVLCAALGVGTLLAALTVAYRDFTHLTPFLVQLWMYATPVVFPASLVPERWRWVLYLNPMSGLIEGFRSALIGRSFDMAALAISATLIVTTLVVGVAYFEKVERHFADII